MLAASWATFLNQAAFPAEYDLMAQSWLAILKGRGEKSPQLLAKTASVLFISSGVLPRRKNKSLICPVSSNQWTHSNIIPVTNYSMNTSQPCIYSHGKRTHKLESREINADEMENGLLSCSSLSNTIYMEVTLLQELWPCWSLTFGKWRNQNCESTSKGGKLLGKSSTNITHLYFTNKDS